MRRFPHAVAAATALIAAAPAAAATTYSPPMNLPGRAIAASASETWIVGARPGAAAATVARRAHAQRIAPGIFEVRAAAARDLAHRLRVRHLLTYAERNGRSHFASVAEDPLSAPSPFREASFDPMLDPPAVTADSPLLGVIDEKADIAHPEFTGDTNVSSLPGLKVVEAHGTQTLGTAVAPVNGIGITGAYPSARAINVPLPKQITCAKSAKAIRRAVQAGVSVINMSYGSAQFCFSEYIQLENAVRRGVVPVAAGGNDGDRGNPLEYPASLPHILTVGALQPDDTGAAFSNTNGALDLLAPGVGITAPTPLKLDTEDGNQDGYEVVDGTSFAAPIAAAATLWLRAARTDLTFDQAENIIKLSATDLGKKGYDTTTGYGKLNMASALTATTPAADVGEPNEDIYFVNGKVIPGGAQKPVWTGGAPTTFQAFADYYKDPVDTYRVRVPAHKRVTVTIKPAYGNPDLELYDGAAKKLGSKRHLVAVSHRTGTKPDRVSARNKGGKTRTAYIAVLTNKRPVLDTRYSIDIR